MDMSERIKLVGQQIFQSCIDSYEAIECICLSTTDGFPVLSLKKASLNFEADAMAAASSTLYSVSNAVSRQMLARPFRMSFIESAQGNVMFVAMSVANKEFVLTVSGSDAMNIGQLRAIVNRMVTDVYQHELITDCVEH
ncbi:roadblock/LC7 domain-containing protein [Oceanobacter mangrovi]|uniref:roadblock/LC7 domain-containing protein n=1 Tax=Oceanobacter mangrovi TaxID=2862510 RepID=UPI001C8F068D|nr:hypothetical protein [Oceanobacter mangrovi]